MNFCSHNERLKSEALFGQRQIVMACCCGITLYADYVFMLSRSKFALIACAVLPLCATSASPVSVRSAHSKQTSVHLPICLHLAAVVLY